MKTLLIVCALCLPGWGRVLAQDAVTVPFQFTGNHIFVPISINARRPFTALIDTGCSSSLMAPSVAKQLHLTSSGNVSVEGFGGKPFSARRAEVEAVQIGSAAVSHPAFIVVDLGAMAIETIIGGDVLRRFVVRVDYDARLLTLTRPDEFVYRGGGVVLPLRLHTNTPTVDGTVDGIKGVFTLDTGSGNSLDLFGPFIQAHDLRRRYPAGFTAATGLGLGGLMRAQSVRVGSLRLGAAEVRKVETNLTADSVGEASDSDVSGNIGGIILRQFNVTFDYTHGQVILEGNREYGRAEGGHAGFALEPQGRAWRVVSVAPEGAAGRAGIKEGDRVLQVGGRDASQLSPLALQDIFHRPAGTKVWMLLQEGGQKRLVAVTLGKVP